MLAQRGADLRREAVKVAEEKRESRAAVPSTASRRRLTFNEKHALGNPAQGNRQIAGRNRKTAAHP